MGRNSKKNEILSLIPDSIKKVYNAQIIIPIYEKNYYKSQLIFSDKLSLCYYYDSNIDSVSNPNFENQTLFNPKFALNFGETGEEGLILNL